MDVINVDFRREKPAVAQETPSGSTAKKLIVTTIVTLVVAAILYYCMLPALNFKAIELYFYLGAVLGTFIGVFGLVTKAYFRPEYTEYAKNKVKVPIVLIIVLVAVVGIGYLVGAELFRAKDYRDLITVTEGNFVTDIAEIDFKNVPLLDKDSSSAIATRTLGELSDYVSQFVISDVYSTQINYKGKPVRVYTLGYGDVFKWLKNTGEGIPAYIIVNMTTEDNDTTNLEGELVRLEKPMKFSPSEHFNEYLMRHVRFKYPTLLLGTPSFEIDDNANPYWIVPVEDRKIGLFGGRDVIGAIIVDAVTGDTTLISTSLDGKTKLDTTEFVTDEKYQWIDHVYSASVLNEQYNYYGKYINGFWNSLIGQSDVRVTSSGYNYLALNDDVYMYTGVTSISSDESIIGFVLINQRTKEAKYYQQAGALEDTAKTSAQGKVADYGYTATFPLLINVGGEPTYFMSMKDASQMVKTYTMVNVERSTIVGEGKNPKECMENYIAELAKSGVYVDTEVELPEEPNTPTVELVEVTGIIESINSATTGGETYFYIKLVDNPAYYKVAFSKAEKVVILKAGDTVTVVVEKDATGDIVAITELK